MTKVCRRCRKEKETEYFSKNSRSPDGLFCWCRSCKKDYMDEYRSRVSTKEKEREYRLSTTGATMRRVKAWRENNVARYKDVARRSHLLTRVGISPGKYHTILSKQSGKCAICDFIPEDGSFLDVDHDHATGRIRGLLCRECNLGLGKFKDRTDLLMKAIEYIDNGYRE